MAVATKDVSDQAPSDPARDADAIEGHVASRDRSVDVLRGVAILLVVLGHANRGAIEAGLPTRLDLPMLDFVIYAVHMPVFFLLAGFFTRVSLTRRPAPRFAADRLTKIVWPYILWSIIYFASGWVMAKVTTITHPLTLHDLESIYREPINILWFLYALLILQLLATLLHRQPWLLFGLALAASVAAMLLGHPADPSFIERVAAHAPFFALGVVMAGHGLAPVWPRMGAAVALGAMALFVAVAAGLFLAGVTVPIQFATIPLSLLGMLGLAGLCAAWSRTEGMGAGIANALGRASLGIYLLHPLVLAVVPRLLKLAHADGALARLIIGTIVGTGGAWLAYRLVERLKLAPALGLR